MQGSSRPDRELLDAAALCSHLLGEGSVHAFLAEHRHERQIELRRQKQALPKGRGVLCSPSARPAEIYVPAWWERPDAEALRSSAALPQAESRHRI